MNKVILTSAILITTVAGSSSRADTEVSPNRAVATVTLGVLAVGGLFSGTAFAASAAKDADAAFAIRVTCPSSVAHCPGVDGPVNAQGRDALISFASFLAGGVFIGASAIVWFAWPTKRHTPSVVLGPTYIGLRGAF